MSKHVDTFKNVKSLFVSTVIFTPWHLHYNSLRLLVCFFVCFLGVTTLLGSIFHTPIAGFSLLIRGFLITHNDAPQSAGLFWTSVQLVAETSP